MTPRQPISLHDQLLRECDAMAKHALASGMKIPASVVQKLECHLASQSDVVPPDASQPATDKSAATDAVSKPAAHDKSALAELAAIHQSLATIVAPALPRSIRLIAEEATSKNWLRFLGPVPLVRHMMLAAIISLIGVVGSSLSPEVDEENIAQSLLQLSGRPLLLIEIFLISAAGLGASFSALFTANRYVVQGTYDPRYKASYWIRFILGIIAGVILADFVPDDASNQIHFNKALLAILGGFSASVVYRILGRFVDTVESIFRGDPYEQIAAVKANAKAQFDAQTAQTNSRVANRLMSLHRELDDDADPKKVHDHIDRIVEALVTNELATEAAAEPTTAER